MDYVELPGSASIRVSQTAGSSTTKYLIDANNHTGYAQVLEEMNAANALTRSYVIGDDVLAQATAGSLLPAYLLYDGHGSTRQLASNVGTVNEHYGYDAYGTLQTNNSSGTQTTTLLYSGEQYDTTLKMYNLRARFYDPSNGRFNQRDTFAGNNDDPQSLHKYLYAHGKGPFFRSSDLKLLSAGQRQQAVQNVLSSINQNVAYDTLIIDTLGLTAAEVQQLESALGALQVTRPVWLLK